MGDVLRRAAHRVALPCLWRPLGGPLRRFALPMASLARSLARGFLTMFIASIVLMVVGFALYLGAFSQGPGPSMSDKPIQAWMFFGATAFMVTGFLLIVV